MSFQDRSAYLEYQKLTGTLENLSRLSIAYEFTLAEQAQVSSAEVLKKIQTAVKELQESMAENKRKQRELDEEIAKMKKERDNVSENSHACLNIRSFVRREIFLWIIYP